MMASIRTAFIDLQFVDQDFTPTFITAASFSVPGNQTSAIQIGRRLKIFDATAGVQQIIYATVTSVSFTAVTTIHIEADSGSLTSSLSSFGISIISNVNNALPRNSDMTVSSLAVAGGMSISGAAVITGATQLGSTLSVSGAAAIAGATQLNSTLSVSATAVAAVMKAQNTVRAYGRVYFTSSSQASLQRSSFNISAVSALDDGNAQFRLHFIAPMDNTNYFLIAKLSYGNSYASTLFYPIDILITSATTTAVKLQAYIPANPGTSGPKTPVSGWIDFMILP